MTHNKNIDKIIIIFANLYFNKCYKNNDKTFNCLAINIYII